MDLNVHSFDLIIVVDVDPRAHGEAATQVVHARVRFASRKCGEQIHLKLTGRRERFDWASSFRLPFSLATAVSALT